MARLMLTCPVTGAPMFAGEEGEMQAVDRLTPEQRAQLGQYLEQQAQQQGVSVSGAGMGNQYQDSGALSGLMGQMHQQDPGMLGQLLGGMRGGSGDGGGIGKAVLGRIAAMAMKQFSDSS